MKDDIHGIPNVFIISLYYLKKKMMKQIACFDKEYKSLNS